MSKGHLMNKLSLASAKNLTPIQVGHLAADENPEVRQALATNPSTTPAILSYLAEDADRNVRIAVLRNARTPFNVRVAAVESGDLEAATVAYNKASDYQKAQLQPRLVQNDDETLTDFVSRVRGDARRRAFEKMGAALGAEDAELVETW
jgi:hypothetical protein